MIKQIIESRIESIDLLVKNMNDDLQVLKNNESIEYIKNFKNELIDYQTKLKTAVLENISYEKYQELFKNTDDAMFSKITKYIDLKYQK